MRERPILFSAPMVRAILEGRKTQTRRVVKPAPDLVTAGGVPARFTPQDAELGRLGEVIPSPYGDHGHRLWVKETWRPYVAHGCAMDACDCADVNVMYAADGECRFFSDHEINRYNPEWCLPKAADRGNVTPLFMPRWACRLVLEVTDVRVERLHAISEQDAVAEGAGPQLLPDIAVSRRSPMAGRLAVYSSAREIFAGLWETINGPGSWDANPWVWVIDFKRVEVAHG